MGVAKGKIVEKRELSAFVNFKEKVRRAKIRKDSRAYPVTIKSTIHFQVLYLMITWNSLVELELLLKYCSIQTQITAREGIV